MSGGKGKPPNAKKEWALEREPIPDAYAYLEDARGDFSIIKLDELQSKGASLVKAAAGFRLPAPDVREINTMSPMADIVRGEIHQKTHMSPAPSAQVGEFPRAGTARICR